MNEIIIREATIADIVDIQHLAHLLARLEFESGWAAEVDPQWASTEAGISFLKRELTREDGILLVATCDEQAIGFLGGWIRPEEQGPVGEVQGQDTNHKDKTRPWQVRQGPVGGLQGVFVLPAFRRRGVGARLIDRFLEWCELRNLDKASVAVAPANEAAIALYESMGFEATTLILERQR